MKHLKTGLKCPVFEWCTIRKLDILVQSTSDHSKTGHVRFLDPHCTQMSGIQIPTVWTYDFGIRQSTPLKSFVHVQKFYWPINLTQPQYEPKCSLKIFFIKLNVTVLIIEGGGVLYLRHFIVPILDLLPICSRAGPERRNKSTEILPQRRKPEH